MGVRKASRKKGNDCSKGHHKSTTKDEEWGKGCGGGRPERKEDFARSVGGRGKMGDRKVGTRCGLGTHGDKKRGRPF